jgi:hypothetical protein
MTTEQEYKEQALALLSHQHVAAVATLLEERDMLKAAQEEAQAEMESIHFAAHMPDDYEYGLPSWINQKLYGRLIELLDRDGRVIRRTEDVEAMRGLRKQLEAIRQAALALRPWDETRAGWAEVREDKLSELMALAVGEEEA